MSISIVLRTTAATNTFRDAIIAAIGSGHIDEALLCSGFFQENFNGGHYKVSTEGGLAAVCATSGIALTTVGVHNAHWMAAYQNFQASLQSAGVKVKCLYKPSMHWHAKVFIGSRAGVPQIGIVGSSNMTRPAFSVTKPFNNECDVFLWDRKSPIGGLAAEFADRLGENIVIRAPFIPRMNGGQSVADILSRIRDEVIGTGLDPLES